jgi:YebC/PmpR family DNA-binding regulatory protein
MSGHSKWATTKHKKGAADAKRGKVFTKITKEITVAAKLGGGSPDGNPRLRTAIAKAKSVSMPADNIQRAIKKGTGELQGVSYEEITYEGYGPGGVAVLVEVLTDNKNRTVSDIRHIFSRHNGNLGEAGSVAWMFSKKGYFVFSKADVTEDRLVDVALEAGADDVREQDDGTFEVVTEPSVFEEVKKAFEDKGVKYQVAELSMIPQTYVPLEGKPAEQMIRLMNAIEDSDDVQNVYANFDIPDEVMEAAANS